MKHLLIGMALPVWLALLPVPLAAWDGFDAETTDLVEIIPDELPMRGATVEVFNHDTDQGLACMVENITRNKKTVEIVVRDPSGKLRTLVMEWR